MSSPSSTSQSKGRWLQASESWGNAAGASEDSPGEGSTLQLLRKSSSQKRQHKPPLWENHTEFIN